MYIQEKQELVDYGNKLITDGYTLGTGGNLSHYIPEDKVILMTPSGIPFDQTTAEDIVVMQLDGKILEGDKKPSSEWRMHAIMYEGRNDLNFVIHAHTVYSTAMAVLRQPLPASHYMIAVAGKDVRCAEYASFGTEELSLSAFEAMKDRKAVLLANHGVLTAGATITEAYSVLEQLEYCSKVHLIALSAGTPTIMPDEEMAEMAERFKSYGQK